MDDKMQAMIAAFKRAGEVLADIARRLVEAFTAWVRKVAPILRQLAALAARMRAKYGRQPSPWKPAHARRYQLHH